MVRNYKTIFLGMLFVSLSACSGESSEVIAEKNKKLCDDLSQEFLYARSDIFKSASTLEEQSERRTALKEEYELKEKEIPDCDAWIRY